MTEAIPWAPAGNKHGDVIGIRIVQVQRSCGGGINTVMAISFTRICGRDGGKSIAVHLS